MKAAYLLPLCPAQSLTLIKSRQINPPGPVGIELIPTGTVTGGTGTVAESLAACGILKWTTPYIGPARRGRTFYGPIPSTKASNGTIITAQLTNHTAFVTAMLARYGSGGTFAATARLVIWSVKLAQTFSQDPPPAMGNAQSASAYVTAGVALPIVHNMRRRTIGSGS